MSTGHKARRCLRVLLPYLTFSTFVLVVGKYFLSCRTSVSKSPLKIKERVFKPPDGAPLSKILNIVAEIKYSPSSPLPCGTTSPFLLVIVHSAPRHFLHRSTIRKSWGSLSEVLNNRVRVVFLLGKADDRIRAKLNHEMKTFRDIVQGNFLDSYRNLTYKHLMGYHWTVKHCESAVLIMKADDDVFVDMFQVLSFLKRTFGSKPKHLLACLIVPPGSQTKREGKWTVSKEEYSLEIYPEYCSGMAYIVTPDVMEVILDRSRKEAFFWIDDVLITGFIAEKAKVMKTDLSVWFARSEYSVLNWLSSNSTRPCPWMIVELTPNNWPENVIKLWTKTVKAWNRS